VVAELRAEQPAGAICAEPPVRSRKANEACLSEILAQVTQANTTLSTQVENLRAQLEKADGYPDTEHHPVSYGRLQCIPHRPTPQALGIVTARGGK
jgi:hypothetical protein